MRKMMCSQQTQESNPQLFQEQVEVDEAEEEEEEEEDGKLDSPPQLRRHLSMLRLNSAARRRHRRHKCTACGSGGSMKRPSPPSFPQPSPKRLSLLPPSPSSVSGTAAATTGAAFGSKQPPSLLHRSLSEPIDSLGLGALNAQTSDNLCFGQFLNSASPENSKIPAKNSDSRPPIPPLHRSLSDPTVALEFQPPPVAPTPPRPSVVPTPPSSSKESPNTKRLKRMEERMRQMREWWDQVLQEEDNEHSSYSQQHNNNSKEEEGEESVWVEEKSGEWLVIHFKCPCNKGYQILLSGNNCYYKLM